MVSESPITIIDPDSWLDDVGVNGVSRAMGKKDRDLHPELQSKRTHVYSGKAI